MNNYDEAMMNRIKALEREVERLRVKESLNKSLADTYYLSVSMGGWNAVYDTWTYNAPGVINVVGVATDRYAVGDKLKLKIGGVQKYYYIIAVGATTITVTGGSDYTHEAGTVSEIYHSHQASPVGFAHWFSWVGTFTGWVAGSPSVYITRFSMTGKTVHFYISMSDGTSNANNATLTLPIIMANNGAPMVAPVGIAFDNGVLITSTVRWQINQTAPSLLAFYVNGSSTGFTTTGTKRFFCQGFYEAA